MILYLFNCCCYYYYFKEEQEEKLLNFKVLIPTANSSFVFVHNSEKILCIQSMNIYFTFLC